MLLYIRQSFRRAINDLSTSFLAVLVLVLGISLTVTMFALTRGILWTSPDVGVDNLIQLSWESNEWPFIPYSLDDIDFNRVKQYSNSFDTLVTYSSQDRSIVNYEGDTAAKKYPVAAVDPGFFDLIKVKPLLGRLFSDEDSHNDNLCILSYRVWRDYYLYNPDVLGRNVHISSLPSTIIGVLPEGFQFPNNAGIWKIRNLNWAADKPKKDRPQGFSIGVLKHGISSEAAELELKDAIASLKVEYPDANSKKNIVIVRPYNEMFSGSISSFLFLLLGGAILVLIVACTNVSNLILSNLAKRQQELAIKRSIGANKYNIFLEVQSDIFILIFVSLPISLLLSFWACRIIWPMFVDPLEGRSPYWWSMEVDMVVFLFSVGIASLCVFFAGLLPALRAMYANVMSVLKDDSRTSTGIFAGRFSRFLICMQIIISSLLLIGAISYSSLMDFMTGLPVPYDPNKILHVAVQANHEEGYKNAKLISKFYRNVDHEIESIPGVTTAALSRAGAGLMSQPSNYQIVSGEKLAENESHSGIVNIVSEDFFKVFDVEPLDGRFFLKMDTHDREHVVVVNRAFVDKHFPSKNSLGEFISIKNISPWWDPQYEGVKDLNAEWSRKIKIIGVVENLNPGVRGKNFSEIQPVIYLSFNQYVTRNFSVLIAGAGDLYQYIPSIRQVFKDENPAMALNSEFETISDLVDKIYSGSKIVENIISTLGFASLFMASIGLYGLISFATQQRKREFGIRMALGASTLNLVMLMMKNSRWIVLIGVIFGALGGIAINRLLMKVLLIELPIDYFLIASGALSVAILVGLAIFIPSYRAASDKPSIALRGG